MEKKNNTQQKHGSTHPISKKTLVFMLIFAGASDAGSFIISFVPAVGQALNWVLASVVFLTLWFWFAFSGLGVRAALWGGAGMSVAVLPVLQALPLFTAVVLTVYIRSRVGEVVPVVPKKGARRRAQRARAHST